MIACRKRGSDENFVLKAVTFFGLWTSASAVLSSNVLPFKPGQSSSPSESSSYTTEPPDIGVKIVTVTGRPAELPCDISPLSPGDSVYLVLWYRRESGTPIYSYDSRRASDNNPSSSGYDQPDRWSEPTAFGDRAHFRVTTNPAVLAISSVQKFDGGNFICRVDFRQSPTVYHHVTLEVVVPPQAPIIVDDRGRPIVSSVLGPYREADSLTIECHVAGGNPLPTVFWYMNDKLLDDTFQKTFEGTVKNGLVIRNLKREHSQGTLRCRASNNNITGPVEAQVQIRMLFPPEGAKITGPAHPMASSRPYDISCTVWGSNPAARIEWYLGTKSEMRPVKAFNSTVEMGGNVTVSWLRFRPRPEHHHKTLTCRGANEELLTSASQIVEDYRRLEIFYPPRVNLALGRMVNPDDLEEGDDLYFTCEIDANPPAYKLTWWHNGEEVDHDQSKGIIISNQSLVLQDVSRASAGSYTCEASNVEGDQVSHSISITIMYKPVCMTDQKLVYGVSESETAHISCKVDAYPEAEVFNWSFNTSSGGHELPRSLYTNQGSASLLSYTPRSQMDYGTVLCWSSNLVGRQMVPCVFHVIPAGPPDTPKNCSVTNQTQDSLQVDCQPGFSSGLKQEFHMEVFTHPDHQLLVNITARMARLLARGLPADQSLFLRIYASSAKGRSRSVTFDAYTLTMADKQTVVDGSSQAADLENTRNSWSLLTVVLLAAILTLIVFIVVVTMTAKIGKRCTVVRQNAPGSSGGHNGNNMTQRRLFVHQMEAKEPVGSTTLVNQNYQDQYQQKKTNNGASIGLQHQSPDLIPQFAGSASPASLSPGQIRLRGPSSASYSASLHVVNGNRTVNNPTFEFAAAKQQLYSPAGTSDSSGFSERFGGGASGFGVTASTPSASDFGGFLGNATNVPPVSHGLMSLPGYFRQAPTFTGDQNHPGRVGSPGSYAYQNHGLTASPFSTLPRRPPPPSLSSSVMSPTSVSTRTTRSINLSTMEVTSPSSSSTRSAATGVIKITARTPLLEDDRESCV